MAYITGDVPAFRAHVRYEFLRNLEDGHGESRPCTVFGVTCRGGWAIGWHVLLDSGAVVGRLPINALWVGSSNEKLPSPQPLPQAQLWDCFSTTFTVHEYAHLGGKLVDVAGGGGQGRYLFTIDYSGSPWADGADCIGWKCHHVIELESGNITAQPNNRVLWYDPAIRSGADTLEPPRDLKLMTHEFSCEAKGRWGTSDEFMYGVRA